MRKRIKIGFLRMDLKIVASTVGKLERKCEALYFNLCKSDGFAFVEKGRR